MKGQLLRSVEACYLRKHKAGSGASGEVFLATDKASGVGVAVKRMRDGQAEGAVEREHLILAQLQACAHVVRLVEVVTNRQGTRSFMVMEQMQHDLRGLLEEKTISARWSRAQVKGYVWQLMCGLAYCHEAGFMHRDVKPENLLIDRGNVLKLADFGLAGVCQPPGAEHNVNVISRWYRPLELFYGHTRYGCEIDMWSAGCVMGELLQNSALMPGVCDEEQPHCIYALCGTPLENGWYAAERMPNWLLHFPAVGRGVVRDLKRALITENKLSARRGYFSEVAVELLDQLLALDPSKRISAATAMRHAYFTGERDQVPTLAARDMLAHNEKSYFAKGSATRHDAKKTRKV